MFDERKALKDNFVNQFNKMQKQMNQFIDDYVEPKLPHILNNIDVYKVVSDIQICLLDNSTEHLSYGDRIHVINESIYYMKYDTNKKIIYKQVRMIRTFIDLNTNIFEKL